MNTDEIKQVMVLSLADEEILASLLDAMFDRHGLDVLRDDRVQILEYLARHSEYFPIMYPNIHDVHIGQLRGCDRSLQGVLAADGVTSV